jgi:hypothetical protein
MSFTPRTAGGFRRDMRQSSRAVDVGCPLNRDLKRLDALGPLVGRNGRNACSLPRLASGVQAALTTFVPSEDRDVDDLYSLGGTFDTPFYIFYRNADPITSFAQFRGKRLAVGPPALPCSRQYRKY